MNKHFLIILCCTLATGGLAQANFKWDVIDSISKNKSEIYSLTKLFIAENWNSAKDVIQNDDKEAGAILVKGITIQTINKGYGPPVDYKYSYTVKFLMKENKYRIIIENVNIESAKCAVTDWPLVPACDCDYDRKTQLSQKQYDLLLFSLKNELQNIVNKYEKYMNKESEKTGW